MVRITISDEQKQQLLAAEGEVELCDAAGRRIARATPDVPDDFDPWSYFPELTEEEIQRRCNEPGPRYTTQEVKEYLLKRKRDS